MIEDMKQYQKEYAEKNQERLLIYRKEYAQKNKEKLLLKKNLYRASNKEKICEKAQMYYQKKIESQDKQFIKSKFFKNLEVPDELIEVKILQLMITRELDKWKM